MRSEGVSSNDGACPFVTHHSALIIDLPPIPHPPAFLFMQRVR